MVSQDKTLDHQIQLVFASSRRKCLNGQWINHSAVAVTCNCYRIGESDSFSRYMGAGPTLTEAWAVWNQPDLHKNSKTFKREGKV